MNPNKIFLETGKKKTFAGALDWPGWCRSGSGPDSALQALVDYGPRYAQVLQIGGIDFSPPLDISGLSIVEKAGGDATTDFGSPGFIFESDRAALTREELDLQKSILEACWAAFDRAAASAAGKELKKGPRGGGRDLDKIIEHITEAERAYLGRLGWKFKRHEELDLTEELTMARKAVLEALDSAVKKGLPESGPRGGVIWPVRYFLRRSAWHTLDHAWETEDRII